MTVIVSTKEYILQGITIPKVLGTIIDDYTPDFDCTFSDGRKEYFKNKDFENIPFEQVISIVVYIQLVITRSRFGESITGKVI